MKMSSLISACPSLPLFRSLCPSTPPLLSQVLSNCFISSSSTDSAQPDWYCFPTHLRKAVQRCQGTINSRLWKLLALWLSHRAIKQALLITFEGKKNVSWDPKSQGFTALSWLSFWKYSRWASFSCPTSNMNQIPVWGFLTRVYWLFHGAHTHFYVISFLGSRYLYQAEAPPW